MCFASVRILVMSSQLPVEVAVVAPIWVEPSYTFTVLPAAAVPLSSSVLLFVMLSPTTPLSVENEAMTGAAPEFVPVEPDPDEPEVPEPMTAFTGDDAALALAAASVAVAVRAC